MNKESNEQHTPGPWKVYRHVLPLTDAGKEQWPDSPDAFRTELRIGTERDHPQLHAPAPVVSTGHTPFYGEGTHIWMSEADAVLIAAAPTMLAALQKLMPFCDEGDVEIETEWQRAVADARAAIAKATTDSSIPPDPAGGA
jgi:hypothetical protein